MDCCAVHPQRIAIEKCAQCDVPICEQCKNIVKGRFFCPTCATELIPGVSLVPERVPHFAAFLSLICPGAGQVYNGQLGKGLKIFLFFWLVLPWVYGVYDAYLTAKLINQRLIATRPSLRDFLAFLLVVMVLILSVGIFLRAYRSPDYFNGLVGRDLGILSQAAEKYREDNGKFPNDFSQLYFSSSPYVDEIYCDIERHGYKFTCQFSEQGYVFTAKSVEGSDHGDAFTYTMTTGEVLTRAQDSHEKN